MSAAPKITAVMTQIVDLLAPLDPGDRSRVVKAAFTLLGESEPDLPKKKGQSSAGDEGDPTLPQRANTWLRQQGVTTAQLQEVFHVQDGQVEIIASSIPGKGKKGQTINAYVLQGLRGLLATGEPTFDDKSARLFCRHVGCFDEANHALIMKDSGNFWIGSKESGWRLTAPGLKHGADLVKELTAAKQ